MDWPIEGKIEPGEKKFSWSTHHLSKDTLSQAELNELENLKVYLVEDGEAICEIQKHESFVFCHYRNCESTMVDTLGHF